MRWDTFTYFKDSQVRSKDIFDLFDAITLKDNKTYYVQIKSNKFPTLSTYQKWSTKWKQPVILINVVDRKGVKTKYINP